MELKLEATNNFMRIIIIAATMWLLNSCSYTEKTAFNENYDFKIFDSLHNSTIIKLDSVFLKINSLSVTDSIITVYSKYSNNLINNFNERNGKLLNAYLKMGKAKGEFLIANAIYYSCQNKSATIYDPQSQKMVTYPITTDKPTFSEISIPDIGFKTHPIGDSMYLTTNQEVTSVLSLVKKDKTIATFFEYPDDGINAPISKAFAYQGFMIPNVDTTRFVFAGSSSDIIEIYELKNQIITKIKSYGNIYPSYIDDGSSNRKGVIYNNDSKIGFTSVCLSEKNIYALYSGRDMSNLDTYYQANKIYVLDWDGNLIRKIVLDNYVSTICVDRNDENLYAVKELEEACEIIKYSIK